jgi:hypothetical protein
MTWLSSIGNTLNKVNDAYNARCEQVERFTTGGPTWSEALDTQEERIRAAYMARKGKVPTTKGTTTKDTKGRGKALLKKVNKQVRKASKPAPVVVVDPISAAIEEVAPVLQWMLDNPADSIHEPWIVNPNDWFPVTVEEIHPPTPAPIPTPIVPMALPHNDAPLIEEPFTIGQKLNRMIRKTKRTVSSVPMAKIKVL